MADSSSPGNVADDAIATYKAGDVDTAVPKLRQAIEFEPERFDLRMYLGLALGRQSKWKDAERQFGEACDIDGSSADAAFYQGVAIAKQAGRLREAHGMFQVALGNDPNHAKAKAAEEQTRAAAAEVTKEGSSLAMVGGITAIDLAAVEVEAMMLENRQKRSGGGVAGAMPGDVADALAEMGGGAPARTGGGPAAQPARRVQHSKKSGCFGGLFVLGGLLTGLGLLVGWFAAALG